MPNSLYVGNLSYQMTDDELAQVFSGIGPVKSAKIVRDRVSGRSRGFGFVEFDSPDLVKKGLELNNQEIKGRKIFVSEAREKAGP